MFSIHGFLGTPAYLFMDIVTIYFAILPLLLFLSIKLAINKKYIQHFYSQAAILTITIIAVLIFEIGVRVTGGFLKYATISSLPFNFLVVFLIIHILIAIFAVIAWIYLFISTLKLYKKGKIDAIKESNHKLIGKIVFLSMFLTCVMGVMIYIFLFVFVK